MLQDILDQLNLSLCEYLVNSTNQNNNRQMETQGQSSMLSTKEFIRRKCTKDHFNNSITLHGKHSSVYASDFHKQTKNPLINLDLNIDLAKSRCSQLKNGSQYIGPLSTVYMKSFQKCQIPIMQKYSEKKSFFLKTENYQPISSTYNKSIIFNQSQLPACKIEKGRPLMDNLSVPKYNKMTTKSLYRESYDDYTKLPSVYVKRNDQRKRTNLKISSRIQSEKNKKQL